MVYGAIPIDSVVGRRGRTSVMSLFYMVKRTQSPDNSIMARCIRMYSPHSMAQ